jgi:hypothetical protein
MNTSPHTKGVKLVKFFGHPVLLVIAFLTLPYDAYKVDGLYVNIIINTISQGPLYSILAVTGVIIILLTWIIFRRNYIHPLEFIANFLGSYSLLISFIVYAWCELKVDPNKLMYRTQGLLFFNFVFISINFMAYYFYRLEDNGKAKKLN